MSDDYDLERFVQAQAPIIERVRGELLHGRKQSHWMWFVFPQLAGLGHSDMARRYAISGLPEARAYLAHPVLGPRLRELVALAVAHGGDDAKAVFGPVDALKFRSCLTLFAIAAPDDAGFGAAILQFFGGGMDDRTFALLA
jgi:uncharacterized protein (DUF1810 family)